MPVSAIRLYLWGEIHTEADKPHRISSRKQNFGAYLRFQNYKLFQVSFPFISVSSVTLW